MGAADSRSLHDSGGLGAKLQGADGKARDGGVKRPLDKSFPVPGHHRGHIKDLVKSLLIVDSAHDVLSSGFQTCKENVHVVGRLRNIQRHAGPQIKVDVVQPIHQSPNLVNIPQRTGSGPTAFQVDHPDRCTAGSQVNAVLAEIQIVFAIAAVKNHPFGSLGQVLRYQLPGKEYACAAAVHARAGSFEHVQGIFQPRFKRKSGFFQDDQRRFMDGFDVVFRQRSVLPARQAL